MKAKAISRSKPPPLFYDPPQVPLKVLHKDDDLLVLSKPSNLLSVPGRKADQQDSLEIRAREQFPECLLIHRLDMETSGIFLMALNKAAQGNIGKQFEHRKVAKTYIARVFGHPSEDAGLIDLPLICDWENRPKQMVCYEHGKPSQTKWSVMEREGGDMPITRLRLEPITGRSHQLRVHLAEIGHPILGEPFYATDEILHCVPRLQLHAESLSIHHPSSDERITFHDPCPF